MITIKLMVPYYIIFNIYYTGERDLDHAISTKNAAAHGRNRI